MLICVPNVLTKADVAEFRRIMDASSWEDGRSTAGAASAMVKRNEERFFVSTTRYSTSAFFRRQFGREFDRRDIYANFSEGRR